jgi:nucleoside phosphorylase/DNA-binding CsgD family transcriptional regulator
MSARSLTDDQLRALCHDVEANLPPWVPRAREDIAAFLREVAQASASTREAREFQHKLWESEVLTSTGLGLVKVDAALDDAAFRHWLATEAMAPLPEDDAAKLARLKSIFDHLVEQFEGQRKPWLKILRLLAVLFPREFTTLASNNALEQVVDRLVGGMHRGPIERNQAIVARLDRVLGRVAANDYDALAVRITLPWQLHLRLTAGDEEQTEVVDESGKPKLRPLPAARRRKGLTAFKGYLQTMLAALQAVGDGITRVDFIDSLRAERPGNKYSSHAVFINCLQGEFGVICSDGDLYKLTPSGHALLETGDPDALSEWLLTSVLGFDLALLHLRDHGPISNADLKRAIQKANPGWTGLFTPNAITAWLYSLGLSESAENQQLKLTQRGWAWADKIHWAPAILSTIDEIKVDDEVDQAIRVPRYPLYQLPQVDVLIVTALKLELDALREVKAGRLEPWQEIPGEHAYWLATFEGEQGPIRVAAARLTEMGGVASALVAQELDALLLPASLAMCGVCAGHPEDTDRGDVIIADRVFQHDFGKQKVSGFQGDLWPHMVARRWRYIAQELEGPAMGLHGYAEAGEKEARWWFLDKLLEEKGFVHDPLRSTALRRYITDERRAELLGHLEDELGDIRLVGETYELTDGGRDAIRRYRVRHGTLIETCPYHIHVGPIGSGNKVEADGQVWGCLAEGGMRKILGVDMEAATIGAVAANRGLPFAVVKGVMDHADPQKSDRYKTFAARASGEVLLHFLRRVVHPAQATDRVAATAHREGNEDRIDFNKTSHSEDLPPHRIRPESDESIEQRLEVLRTTRKQLSLTGQDVSELDREILRLRREQRAGPALGSGELLAGRYELTEQIGRGGFANVWKAWDPIEDRPVAIKLLRWDQGQDRSVVKRFCGGARQQASLRHPAVVEVLSGPLQDQHHHFFVMPWLVGGDLRRAIEDGLLERGAALEVVARALEGLDAAHQRGWVHRDVKPANILIDTKGLGYMADFDLVRAEDTTRATRTAAAMGTYLYAAPEQMQEAKTVDVRADVYSAAMTVLFVLGRKNPPPLVLLTEPGYIDELGCGNKLAGALRGALGYRPDERTTTCAELITALRDPGPVRPARAVEVTLPKAVEVTLPKVGLKADAPAGTTIGEIMGKDMAQGPDLMVIVEKGDDKPNTGDDAIKDAEMVRPKDLKVETLPDGYVLTFTNDGALGTNYWVNARREIGGGAYWCSTTASSREQSDAAVLFVKSLRKVEHAFATRLRWAVARMGNAGKLNDRERDILDRVLQGRKNDEICLELGISRATVRLHMHNIFTKTGTTNREALLREALQLDRERPQAAPPKNSSQQDVDDNALDFAQFDQLRGTSEDQLGGLLRELRLMQGLEMDQLAGRSGLDEDVIDALEDGRYGADVATLRRVAVGLGIRVGVIFTLWGKRAREPT